MTARSAAVTRPLPSPSSMSAPRSPSALVDSRPAKVESEFAKCAKFCKSLNCRGVFLFFGSARAIRPTTATGNKEHDTSSSASAASPLDWTREFWTKTVSLSRQLTEWSVSEGGVRIGMTVPSLVHSKDCDDHGGGDDDEHAAVPLTSAMPSMISDNKRETDEDPQGGREQEKVEGGEEGVFHQPLMCCAGGGPGFMEAVAEGASSASPDHLLKPRNCAIAIKLPFETRVNPFVSPNCHITVDHFFTRKYWETLMAKAVIVCPGGVGTCEEFLEIMTLQQCHHMPCVPVVLLGKEFWNNAINLQYLAEKGMMSQKEIEFLCITDSVEEAYDFILDGLRKEAAEEATKKAQKKR